MSSETSDIADQEASTVTHQLMEQGTKRGKARLVNSLGFTCNPQFRRSYATYWKSTVRPKENPSRASVTERDGSFQPGKNSNSHRGGVYRLIRKLMALPFLPRNEIQSMFLHDGQAQTEPLRELAEYVKRQWMESTAVLPPKEWSVYKQPIRTNNDIERWHNAWNRRAGGLSGLPLYSLKERPN